MWRGVEARFVIKSRDGWRWSHVRPEPTAAHYIGEASHGYRYVTGVAPPSSAPLRLIAGDCLGRSFVVREGSIEDIRDVIGECDHFEYYVAPKDIDRLLCENHHDVLIAVGDVARARLIGVASRHPEELSHEPPS